MTTRAVIDGCIWACAADQIDDYGERLGAIYDIALSTVDSGRLAMRSSSESGLHLIAPSPPGAQGVWGIVLGVDDVPATCQRFRAASRAESVQPAHDPLPKHGLVLAGQFLGTNVYLRAQRRSSDPDLRKRPARTKPYVYLFAWVVQPENLERYAGQLTALLGADFEKVAIPGAHVAISWDSGFELIAPEPREVHPVDGKLDETTTDVHYDHLLNRGESPWSIVLRVPDIEAFRDRAVGSGYDVSPSLQEADAARRRSWYRSWTRKVIEQREIRLPEFLGLRLMAGQVTYAVDGQAAG